MKIALLTAALILLSTITTPAIATPNAATWKRVVFLGFDAKNFYTMEYVRKQPGSYFEYTDIINYCKYSNTTGKAVVCTPVRKVHHKDTTSNGDWTHTEQIKRIVNIHDKLKKAKVYPAFPSGLLAQFKVELGSRGLVMKHKGKVAVLAKLKALKKLAGWMKAGDLVRNVYNSKTFYYFVVSGKGVSADEDRMETVVALPAGTINKAIKRLMK